MQNQKKNTILNAVQVKKLFNGTKNNTIININIDDINKKYKITLEGEILMAKKSALEIHIEESNKRFDALEQDVSVLKQDVSVLKQDVSTLKDGIDKILKALNIN